MTPGKLRGRLEKLNAEVRAIESDLAEQGQQGVVQSHEIRFEVTEASEALERAIEALDRNYRSAS